LIAQHHLMRHLKFSLFSLLLALACIIFNQNAWAISENQYGIGLGYAGGPSGIDNASQAHGVQLTLDDYVPAKQWHHFQLFFQGSAAYYHSTYEPLKSDHGDNLWVFAIAPVIRYHFLPQATVDPFIDISSGPGYLSTIYYENRNLGLHFTFQDMVGIGTTFGTERNFAAEIRIIHYSNAGISDHNRGLTVPLILSLTYQL
jgi:hypothetical protein